MTEVRKNRYGQFHYGESYYYAPIPLNVGEGSVLITSNPLLIFEVPPVFVGGRDVNIQSSLAAIKLYIPLFVAKDNTIPALGLKVLKSGIPKLLFYTTRPKRKRYLNCWQI